MGGRGNVIIGPNNFGEVTKALQSDLARLVGAIALQIEYNAKVESPIDTGNLANLISAQRLGRFSWVVKSDAEYSAPVHEGSDHGTYVIPSNPYMTRGMQTELPKAQAAARYLAAKHGGTLT